MMAHLDQRAIDDLLRSGISRDAANHQQPCAENVQPMDLLLAALSRAGKRVIASGPDNYMAQCPAHDDKNPSLSIRRGTAGVQLKCFAGCATDDVLKVLDLTRAALRKGGRQRVATFDYRGEDGKVRYRKARIEPGPAGRSKSFIFEHLEGGQWLSGRGPAAPILYNLPDVVPAPDVIVCEGEAKAEAWKAYGFAATTNDTGAGKWQHSYTEVLRGKKVLINPDSDAAGQKHLQLLIEKLGPVASNLVVITNPAPHNDIVDCIRAWTAEGADVKGKLTELVQSATPAAIPPERPNAAPRQQDPPEEFHFTDLGNAKRFVRQHGADVRYCGDWGKWLVWSEGHWKVDRDGSVMRKAKATVEQIYVEAEKHDVGSGATREEREAIERRRELHVRHALKSESDDSLFALLKLAETELGIPIASDRLDRDPMLLCVKNGTLDLRTGGLREHRKEDLITKQVPVDFDPAATCPQWNQFLETVTGGNTELQEYLQRAAGYSLTGDVSEQQFFFLYGTGSNGKSTFVFAQECILGPYFQKAPRSLIEARGNGEGIPCDVARLQGTRFVVCNEIDEGKRLAEATVKDLTGGDRIVARFMRKDFFEFDPTFKLWVYGNHRPVVSGSDLGIWRRIHLVPFTVTIPDERRDAHLKEKLLVELPGILTWAIAGCLEWQQSGLRPPAVVVDAVADYRQEMDVLGEFLAEKCVLRDGAWVESGVLFQAFQAWQLAAGVKSAYQVGQKGFLNRLRDRGLQPSKQGGRRGWSGIALVDTTDATDGTYPLLSIEKFSARGEPANTLRTVRSVQSGPTEPAPETAASDNISGNDLQWGEG